MKHLKSGLCAALLLAAVPVLAQEPTPSDPLIEMMSYVPDTLENRRYFLYGDQAAWSEAWGFDLINSMAEFEALSDSELPEDIARSAAWLHIMSLQAYIGQEAGADTFRDPTVRDVYGYDVFMVRQSIQAGSPPDDVSVYRFDPELATLAEALTATGYTASPIEGGTLYSLREDNEVDRTWEGPEIGMMATLNRFAVMDDGSVIIGNHTGVIDSALEAHAGRSLADNHAVQSLLEALGSETLAEYGPLTGLALVDAVDVIAQPNMAAMFAPNMTAEQIEAVATERAAYLAANALPGYTLVGFGTSHANGHSYYTLALVLLSGRDPQAAADVLQTRLEDYTLIQRRQPFTEFMTQRGLEFVGTYGIETEHFPVAVLVISDADPTLQPDPDNFNMVQAGVFRWTDMIFSRDMGFLALE